MSTSSTRPFLDIIINVSDSVNIEQLVTNTIFSLWVEKKEMSLIIQNTATCIAMDAIAKKDSSHHYRIIRRPFSTKETRLSSRKKETSCLIQKYESGRDMSSIRCAMRVLSRGKP